MRYDLNSYCVETQIQRRKRVKMCECDSMDATRSRIDLAALIMVHSTHNAILNAYDPEGTIRRDFDLHHA